MKRFAVDITIDDSGKVTCEVVEQRSKNIVRTTAKKRGGGWQVEREDKGIWLPFHAARSLRALSAGPLPARRRTREGKSISYRSADTLSWHGLIHYDPDLDVWAIRAMGNVVLNAIDREASR